MYTLIVRNDHTLLPTQTQRIVQRSKLCDNIHILIPKTYEEVDMRNCLVTMYYCLPISKERYTKVLTASDELYRDDYVEYIIPADTWITKEAGEVEIELTLSSVSADAFGEVTQYVRKITGGVIKIASSQDWGATLSDSLLQSVDQRIIQLQMLTERLEEIQEADMETMMRTKADNLTLDNNFNLQLTANGEAIGKKIPIVTPGIPDTEDGTNDGMYELGDYEKEENNGCECGCNHSIVELDTFNDANESKNSAFVEI